MRITDNAMNTTFLNNLNKNMRRMMKAQEQATTGKAVSRPSDNPMLVGKILSMRDNIQQNEQYNSNISDTIGWVQTQDTALNDVTKTMHRLSELIQKGANGTLSDTDRMAVKDEVEAKVSELKEILNTNFDGRYIFGGQKTTEPPFSEGLIYKGDTNNIEREIAQGVTVEVLTDGSKVTKLSDDEGDDLGTFLNNIIKALDEGDTELLSGELLGKSSKFLDNILGVRSKVGATHNRLEAAEERNKEENINLKEVLSEKEDVDLAESYMNYIMMTTAYQSSLSMGAKILQPSLLDYLR